MATEINIEPNGISNEQYEMGLSWSLISITDARKEMDEWCARAGINLSEATATGRYPTPDEVCCVLNTLGAYQANYYNFSSKSVFHAIVTVEISSDDTEAFPDMSVEKQETVAVNELRSPKQWTTNINVYAPDNVEVDAEVPHRVYFNYGDLELNIIIAEGLARICGSFLLFEGCSGPYLVPILINPGDTDPQQVIRQWNERFRQHGTALEAWLYAFDKNNPKNSD